MRKTAGSILGSLSIVVALGCTATPIQTLPEINGAFYAVSVRDFEESAAWYVDHLGFEVEAEGGNEQRKGAILGRPGAVLELAEFSGAVSRETVKPGLEAHDVYGIFKLGFTTTDLDQTFEQIESAGIEVLFEIVAASNGQRTFGVRDPDGNIIQFFGP